jgi:hypothetical protein
MTLPRPASTYRAQRQLQERLLSNIEEVNGPLHSKCWIWLGAVSRGYGEVRWQGRQLKTHRASWEIYHGRIPQEMHVLHHCDNARCINPDHLFLGTEQHNADDKVNKGRQPKGETHGRAKLKQQQVIEIRHLLATSNLSNVAIGQRYNIGREAIRRIRLSMRWREDI